MKSLAYKTILFVAAVLIGFSSCVNDLNTEPIDPNVTTSGVVFDKPEAYEQFLAKIYGGMAVSGNAPGDGKQDVVGVDGGSQASFLRGLWNLQELPTEEAVCCWDDQTIKDFHTFSWTSSDVFVKGLYYRLYYQITLASEFLRESTDEKLNARGLNDEWKAKVKTFRAEARFCRALAYYCVLDLFRNGPFVTEADAIGSTPPQFATGDKIFEYIEKELTEIEADMLSPVIGFSATYGRATKASAWHLLAKLYLNAQVYIGQPKYTECITNCNKIIGAGYELEPVYANLFKADNHKSKEVIFSINYEMNATQTWGGMMFLMCSAADAELKSMIAAPGAWGGNRAVVQLLDKFNNMNDARKDHFYTGFGMVDMTTNTSADFQKGVQVLKYSNFNSDGSDSGGSFPNTDFPMMRLGDVYLMYAEAVVRGGTGGSQATAIGLINQLRMRANGDPIQTYNVDFILEERARELYWEATRRTDLVRYGKLTSASYLWQWKGGSKDGRGVDNKYNIYPLPAADVAANRNLKQNEGY